MRDQEGRKLIAECKQHILAVMRSIPACSPDAGGARNSDVEEAAGFSLDLPEQDRWFTWSLLRSLEMEGYVQVLQKGPRARRHYRLARTTGS